MLKTIFIWFFGIPFFFWALEQIDKPILNEIVLGGMVIGFIILFVNYVFISMHSSGYRDHAGIDGGGA